MAIILLLGAFAVLLLFGVPVAVAMLMASILNVLYLQATGMPLPSVIVAERMLSSINSFPLLAVPFFIFAGVIMNRAGLTAQLVNVSRAFRRTFPWRNGPVQRAGLDLFLGNFRIGLGGRGRDRIHADSLDEARGVSAGVCRRHYGSLSNHRTDHSAVDRHHHYGTMTNLSIGALFLAGVVPGFLIGTALMATVALMSRARGFPRLPRMPWRERACVCWRALPALFAPLIILGGIISGLYTATEAG